MTDAEWWTAFAAIGQMASAAAAVVGLGFLGIQVQGARRTADFQSLQEFLRSATERERAFEGAVTEATKKQVFYEFANFLEVHAAALNAKLLPKTSHQIIREKLVDSIAVITEEKAWHQVLFDGVTSPTTFTELGKFMRREKAAIGALVKARAAFRA